MFSRATRRQLSTGDVLVFTLALTSIIVVSGDHASRLPTVDAGLWESAQGLVSTGHARELRGADVAKITHAFAHVGLLSGSNEWPP
jgi:hypothetical protein